MSKKIAIVESSLIIREGLKSVLKNNPNFTVWKDIPQLNDNNFEQIVLLVDFIIINPLEIGFANIAKQIGQWKEKKESLRFIALQTFYCPQQALACFDETIALNEETTTILNKLKKLSDNPKNQDSTESNELSIREKNVLVLVANGMTNKEIADQLNISIHTVITHRKNITKKTNIKSVSGLTLYALLNNLIAKEDIQH